MYHRIAVNYPVRDLGLTYRAPEGLVLKVGDMVDVPLGRRRELGCVIESDVSAPEKVTIKDVIAKREDYPALEAQHLKLFQWMSDYYHYGLGQLIADSLPVSKKKPRPLKPLMGQGLDGGHAPTELQQSVIEQILQHAHGFSKHLVHGVTGSGKTLVFLEVIKRTLMSGKNVLYLLPEINLTPQFLETFQAQLTGQIYPFHSELSASEKFLVWHEASSTHTGRFFIGVRSAVFLPIRELGLVIVDEEHDNSFKQDDRCTYHARDVAIKKAQLADCPVILGSATPALETWHHFKTQQTKTYYHALRERVTKARLPELILVDNKMPASQSPDESTWPLHPASLKALEEALTAGEQALVFINRLGFANYIQCRACGHQFHCKNCSTTLRFFKQRHQLSCQHCEYHEPMPQGCPQCGNLTLLQKGFGTERVQEVLRQQLPNYAIERFDRDEIRTFTALQEKLERFHRGDIHVLVGTQMISKGHNFRNVKRVVILGVDSQLNLPDFRATEKIWQTVVQVAGRAGRYSQDGKVYIQTAHPESELFRLMQQDSFDGFYASELPLRKLCECPPHERLVALYFSAREQAKLVSQMGQVEQLMQGLKQKHFSGLKILGPRPSLVEKRANQFTWTVLLKSRDSNELHNFLKSFQLNWDQISSISLKVDVDPQQLF